MNQIQQLINQMCPNGVEWKCITEIADTFIGLATSVTKYKVSEGILLLHNSDIKEDKIDLKTIEFVDSDFVNKNYSKILHTDDVITVHTGDVGTSAVITSEYDGTIGFTTISSRIKDKKIISPAFLCKILNSRICKDVIAAKTISDRNNLNLSSFDELKIPLPPLAIQTRIVEILDHFTNLTANLTAELNLRRKQFEHYREKLLSLDGVEGVEWKKLEEVCEMKRGNNVKKTDFVDEGVGCIHYGQIYTHYGLSATVTNKFVSKEVAAKAPKAQKNDVVITITSENVEDLCKPVAWLGDEDVAVSSHALILKHCLNAKYLAIVFVSENIRKQKAKYAHSGKVTEIIPEHVGRFIIPVPPLTVQQSIVASLDKFTALIENIEQELDLRQKQYEYYREQLLNF